MPNAYTFDGGPVKQPILGTSTTQNHRIGTKAQTEDGRVYYYASYVGSGTVTVGNLLATAAAGTPVSVAYSSGGAAGAKTVTLASTTATANEFKDGWLFAIDGTGSGQVRKILSHPAATAATLEVTVYDPFETALSTGEISLIKSEWDSVIVTPGDSSAIKLAGVNPVALSAGNTNTQYFWCQTYGEAMVLGNDSVFTRGAPVVPASGATADAGQVAVGAEAGTATASDLEPLVGYIMDPGDATSDGDYRCVDLKIRA